MILKDILVFGDELLNNVWDWFFFDSVFFEFGQKFRRCFRCLWQKGFNFCLFICGKFQEYVLEEVLVWFWKVKVEAKELNEHMLIFNDNAHVRLLHPTALNAVGFVVVGYLMCARVSTVTNVGVNRCIALIWLIGLIRFHARTYWVIL